MRTRTIPRGARHLRTYEEFRSYLEDFVEGIYQSLWVVGRPGTCKTESIRDAVRGRPVLHVKGGQLTPMEFYIQVYHHRGQPVILDDVEHLLGTILGRKLVSGLAEASPAKRMSYGTTSRALGTVPPLFYTTSPLLIISNRATADEAILSRCVTLYFDPTNVEVHRAVAAWFWDQAIHDWFGQHLSRLRPLDARWYVTASHDKRSGRDWRQLVLHSHSLNQVECLVQDIEADPAYPTRESKAQRFAEQMAGVKGASRATYFRVRRRLEENGQLAVGVVAPIPLCRTRPPGRPTELELEALAAGHPPAEDEDRPTPLDVPAREAFSQPVHGSAQGPAADAPRAPMVLDGDLPWERPQPGEDDEGE
jgi:hypothetical protein